jgi:predicted HD superfamily hydrolase involved in NAD metabolism
LPAWPQTYRSVAGIRPILANFSNRVKKMTEGIMAKLQKNLSPKRLKHSRGVSETAVELALLYGADPAKARVAGLLHDCARNMPNNILLHRAETSGILVNDIEIRHPVLLHAPVGALVARHEYGVDDPEILSAIRWHTTGGPDIALLDHVIFLADYIEPSRTFDGVDKLRALARQSLSEAILAAYDATISYITAERGLLHMATVEGRNALLLKMNTDEAG